MKKGNILAHRGWWGSPAEKNSPEALKKALDAGFGIETDFRDIDGLLVISHDPPQSIKGLMTATQFFSAQNAAGFDARIAVNVKADGLCALLIDAIAAQGLSMERFFAFDMSVPDGLAYIKADFPVYSRLSEYEVRPSYGDASAGIWVDNFSGDFPQVERSAACLQAGYRVCIVSPELHGRDHRKLWADIAEAGLHTHPRFEICTDFPYEALNKFGTAQS